MAGNRTNRVQYHCSFCGKNQDQVRRLIAGPGAVYICDECVDLCREIIDEETGSHTTSTTAAKGGGKDAKPQLSAEAVALQQMMRGIHF